MADPAGPDPLPHAPSDVPNDDTGDGDAVSTLEPFFDLVSVFAVTQITWLVSHDATARGLAHAVVAATCLAVAVVDTWVWSRQPPTVPTRSELRPGSG